MCVKGGDHCVLGDNLTNSSDAKEFPTNTIRALITVQTMTASTSVCMTRQLYGSHNLSYSDARTDMGGALFVVDF